MNANNAFEMIIDSYTTIKSILSSTPHLTSNTTMLESHHELPDLSFTHRASCISRHRKLGLLSSLERPTAYQESMLPNISRTSVARFCYVHVLHVASVLGWNLGTCGLDLVNAYHISVVHRQDPNAMQEQKTVEHQGGL